jgi:hypothetical protein
LHIPRKGIFQRLVIHILCDGELRQLLDDCIDVDGLRRLPELVTSMEVDVLPGNRRDLLEERGPLTVAYPFFVRQQAGYSIIKFFVLDGLPS